MLFRFFYSALVGLGWVSSVWLGLTCLAWVALLACLLGGMLALVFARSVFCPARRLGHRVGSRRLVTRCGTGCLLVVRLSFLMGDGVEDMAR